MKPMLVLLILSLLLSACSFADVTELLATVTPAPSLTPRPLPTLADTLTPVPTLTPTITPTLIPTFTLPAVNSPTPFPTITLPPSTPAFLPADSVFVSTFASGDLIVWGPGCEGPGYIDFSAQVSSLRVDYVLLFLRLVAKDGQQSTPWGAGAIMEQDNLGIYRYRVTPETLTHYREFEDAWVMYQMVAATGKLEHLGSTPVHYYDISLTRCPTQ